MPAGADWNVVAGYAERLSARPGERLRVMVSCAGELEPRTLELAGGGTAPVAIARLADPVCERVRTGARVEAPHHAELRPGDGLVTSTWVWLAPGAPGRGRRALLASWGPGRDDGWALTLDPAGRPCLEVAAAGARARVVAAEPLPRDSWRRLEARLDPAAGELRIAAFDLAGKRRWEARAESALGAPGDGPGPLVLGAERPGDEAEASAHLEGKLAEPWIAAGPDGERPVAAWELGEGRERLVPDRGPHGLGGRCVNGPLRAVTGPGWSGDVHDWRWDARGYDAMHFHADSIDDLDWPPVLELEIDRGCPSGLYAVELRCGEATDLVPFVVRRAGEAEPAPRAVLLPTFTYLAYSCERDAQGLARSDQPADVWVREHGLRSLYDRHADGCGAYEASLLRPLTQLRPAYRCPQHGGPHGLAQDLILLRFLARRGLAADLLTDHDLHAEGIAALAGHRTVITGAHPEYATLELLEALEAHVGAGHSLAYLGGNGLNGRVSVDPARPHVAELRRNETHGLAWQALPGEHHHAATGAYGGDWRRQGHPEHRFLGVGLSAFGEAPAASYERPASEDPAAAIVFAGLEPEGPVGAPGAVLGGAAGYEVDNHDLLLGSPRDSVVLASATVGSDYSIWPDDVRDGPGSAPKRRADIVLRRTADGGTVFSVGSIAWTGCLADDDSNPIARVTENALRELDRERPFEPTDG